MARRMADELPEGASDGVQLEKIERTGDDDNWNYQYVSCAINSVARTAELTITAPDSCPTDAESARAEASSWWILRAMRELDEALLNLRINRLDVGLVLLRAKGSAETVQTTDALLAEDGNWFIEETRHFVRRTLKRIDNSAKSFYAVADEGTCFTGTFLEIALAADRIYLLNDPDFPVEMGVSAVNGGLYPMANGISRLETRFLGTPEAVPAILEHAGKQLDAETADELGLATFAPDELDWEDELRLAIEERASFSPDALTGMESNLRFAGPETMETKIFGRLSAWQNWIFQRPNAAGERGALQCYGTPNSPEFNYDRT
jgi:benzoyl-CoA-dihydrodiol lyase